MAEEYKPVLNILQQIDSLADKAVLYGNEYIRKLSSIEIGDEKWGRMNDEADALINNIIKKLEEIPVY